ncbi:hypothetical protein J3E69DRAFT_1334 [Trichoderma sp. SZMC 28015]
MVQQSTTQPERSRIYSSVVKRASFPSRLRNCSERPSWPSITGAESLKLISKSSHGLTIQSVQWLRMGHDLLLRRDLPFRSTFRALDRCLQEQSSPPERTAEKGDSESSQNLLHPARRTLSTVVSCCIDCFSRSSLLDQRYAGCSSWIQQWCNCYCVCSWCTHS